MAIADALVSIPGCDVYRADREYSARKPGIVVVTYKWPNE